MGVINIVSGRFFSFFSMTRFLACANVLRLDEYDFLYLPLCKRKLDFPKRRQDIWTFNQKWPKITKNGQKLPKMAKPILQLQTKIRLSKDLNVLDTVNISKSESIASTLVITQSKNSKNCQKRQNFTKNYHR